MGSSGLSAVHGPDKRVSALISSSMCIEGLLCVRDVSSEGDLVLSLLELPLW